MTGPVGLELVDYRPLLFNCISHKHTNMPQHHSPRRRLWQILSSRSKGLLPQIHARALSTPSPRPARFLPDLKARLGKCILFGLHGEQLKTAGGLAEILAGEWRGLIAGAEGFLLDKGAEEKVRWGEMVSCGAIREGYDRVDECD